MLTSKPQNNHQSWGDFTAFIAVVIVGYGIALGSVFMDSGWNPSPSAIAASLVIDVIYVFWGVRSDELFSRYNTLWGTAVLFIVPSLLVLLICLSRIMGWVYRLVAMMVLASSVYGSECKCLAAS